MQDNREKMSDWETVIFGAVGLDGFLVVMVPVVIMAGIVGIFVYFGG